VESVAVGRTLTETEKRIVQQLSFGEKTAKRVTWEAWEFEIIGPQRIEVTNASYGFEKDEHRYVVTIEERDGVFVPDKCQCPADQYNEEYSCKHRVACATIGGPVLLGAAMAYTSDKGDHSEPTTMVDKIRTDGGTDVRMDSQESVTDETEAAGRPEDCRCTSFIADGGLPCWPCYRDGFEEPNPNVGKDE
jgi:hypothetical protein